MSAAHAPGPWSWSGAFSARDGSSTETLLGEGGYGVLSCDGLGNSPRESDARLIAAAPDLLAALQMVRDYIRVLKGADHEFTVAVDSAIAKATQP